MTEIKSHPTETALLLYERLRMIDFSYILKHGVHTKVFASEKEGDEILEEYRRYIAIDEAFRSSTPVSKIIDKFWHLHLQFTEHYQLTCEMALGKFRHHRPAILNNVLPRTHVRQVDSRMGNYFSVFGGPNPKVWPDAYKKMKGRGRCSNCSRCSD